MQESVQHLIKLQEADTAIQHIEQKKGALPEEIQALEATINKLHAQAQEAQTHIAQLEEAIALQTQKRKDAEACIETEKAKQLQVKNEQEYEQIIQEISYQELEVQLANKKTQAAREQIDERQEALAEYRSMLEEQQQAIQRKKEAIDQIQETHKEQLDKLSKRRKTLVAKLKKADQELLACYLDLAQHLNLVVTYVADEACRGCYQVVTLKHQAAIRKGQELLRCENCHRFLTHVEVPVIEKKPPARRRSLRPAA